jgi:glycogen(starch) synthase
MRILHLAYEDPRQPGSGGGSVRTLEVDRRLAERHEVTALVAAYPGARERIEDGVRWVPIGPPRRGRLPRLAYFALLGPEVRRRRADVVVEDFGAPFGVAMSPLFARAPVVASVQWLFARQMRDKYGLPFDAVESGGLRLYDDFIAVSDWLAGEIRRRRPATRVQTIANGVDPAAFRTGTRPPAHLLFVGRLDREQKGTDLLVDIAHSLHDMLGASMPPLLVAGDGPARRETERAMAARGLDGRVRFLGRVDGTAKFELMAAAFSLLMPSRFETFGLVAAEAQAAGAPVVAFDVGPLREVAAGGGARLAPPFDTTAFAREAAAFVERPALREEVATQGRAWAVRYDWDGIALAVEAHLERAVNGAAGRLREASTRTPRDAARRVTATASTDPDSADTCRVAPGTRP